MRLVSCIHHAKMCSLINEKNKYLHIIRNTLRSQFSLALVSSQEEISPFV